MTQIIINNRISKWFDQTGLMLASHACIAVCFTGVGLYIVHSNKQENYRCERHHTRVNAVKQF